MEAVTVSTRLRLRRADGQVYLDRWGFQFPPRGDRPLFGAFLHKMDASDPGIDLHDHPWNFVSLILRGGYRELRAPIRCPQAKVGTLRRPWSLRLFRLDECHTITDLWQRGRSWSLVLHGPKRRQWGFYVDGRWMYWEEYERTVRSERRDMWAEISNVEEERINVPRDAA